MSSQSVASDTIPKHIIFIYFPYWPIYFLPLALLQIPHLLQLFVATLASIVAVFRWYPLPCPVPKAESSTMPLWFLSMWLQSAWETFWKTLIMWSTVASHHCLQLLFCEVSYLWFWRLCSWHQYLTAHSPLCLLQFMSFIIYSHNCSIISLQWSFSTFAHYLRVPRLCIL